MTKKRLLKKGILSVFVLIVCLVIVIPLVMLISYSLRENSEIITLNAHFFPEKLVFSSYKHSFTRTLAGVTFLTWLKNSLVTAGLAGLVSTYFAAMAGYGFIRYNFKGKKIFFFVLFFSQIMPWIVLLIPYYSMLVKMKMLDTVFSLGFSYLIIYVPMSTWLFIGFFKDHPKSLEEAAKIDGCSIFGAFNRIVIPLVLPSLSAITLFAFIIGWGDFLFASVIVKSAENLTLPLALQSFKGEHNILWSEIMAMAAIITIPIVALFLFMQKYLVNLLAGSIKE